MASVVQSPVGEDTVLPAAAVDFEAPLVIAETVLAALQVSGDGVAQETESPHRAERAGDDFRHVTERRRTGHYTLRPGLAAAKAGLDKVNIDPARLRQRLQSGPRIEQAQVARKAVARADWDHSEGLPGQLQAIGDFEYRAVAADGNAAVITLGSLGELASVAGLAGEGTVGGDALT